MELWLLAPSFLATLVCVAYSIYRFVKDRQLRWIFATLVLGLCAFAMGYFVVEMLLGK